MPLPLIPLVAGAVLGGLAAYLYKDEKLRRDIKRAAGNVSDKVSDGFDELRDKVSGKPGKAADDEVVEAKPKAKKKVVRKKAAAKKATAKKSVRRKAPARKKAATSAEPKPTGEAPSDEA